MQPASIVKTALASLVALWLAACVSVPVDQQGSSQDRLLRSVADVLTTMQETLPGSYNNFAQQRIESGIPHVRMVIEPLPEKSRYLVRQLDQNGIEANRIFVWQFGATREGRLMMDFAPRIDGRTGRSCRVELLPSGPAIQGGTEASECLLPNRDQRAIGLEKEYLLSPLSIETGERLIDLETGQPLSEASTLLFRRELRYRGWAGRVDRISGDWLLAQPFELHNQGDSIELTDSADRPYGYRVQLAQVKYREDRPDILRLALINTETGEQVAYAFASPNADHIGINLGWIQVGMERLPFGENDTDSSFAGGQS